MLVIFSNAGSATKINLILIRAILLETNVLSFLHLLACPAFWEALYLGL